LEYFFRKELNIMKRKKLVVGLLMAMLTITVLAVGVSADTSGGDILSSTPQGTPTINWGTIFNEDIIGGLVSSIASIIPAILPVAFIMITIRLGMRLFRSAAK
jgi:hypothetical protein